jgi:predicted ABC-type transport system involved in lysophospholipase L1 biosynthesis ATPase subunit
MTHSSNVLECRSLGFSYRGAGGSAAVLRGVDLTLPAGARVAIAGESGSGKSTLLHLAAGLETASSGWVRVNGVELSGLRERERTRLRRRDLGIVFQAFHLIPTLTALENVALPLELSGLARGRQARERARNQLARVGLAERADRFPEQLSGGEQQRVAIARALVHEPVLILADEPTGNLDSATGEAVFRLLLEQVEATGSALLMVTHSAALAARLDRTVHMVDGRLLPEGAETFAARRSPTKIPA